MPGQLRVQFEGVSRSQASELAQQLQVWIEQRASGKPIEVHLDRTNPAAQNVGDSLLIDVLVELGHFARTASEHAVAIAAAHFLCDAIKSFLAAKGPLFLGGSAAALMVTNAETGKSATIDPAVPESAGVVQELMEPAAPAEGASGVDVNS